MKVRLTLNGVPFGRELHREIAILYINQTNFTLTGIGWTWVKRADV